MTFNTVEEAITAFVNDLQFSERVWDIDFDKYSANVSKALKRLYTNYSEPDRIRLSAIGKPVVLQMLPVLGYDNRPPLTGALRDIFYLGCEWEERTLAKLEVWHPQVRVERQVDVSWMDISGHADAIMHVDGVGSAVLELKTMHSYGVSLVDKYGMGDDKGYLTQLSLYCAALQMPGYWILYDKGHAVIKVYSLNTTAPETVEAVNRADRIIPYMVQTYTLEDLFTYFKAPPPVPWSTKRAGEFLTVPDSMKYCPHIDDIYKLAPIVGSTKKEVKGVFSKEDIIRNIRTKYDG